MLKTSMEIVSESWHLYKNNWRTLMPYIIILFVPNLVLSALGTTFLYLEAFLPGSLIANNIITLLIFAAVFVLSIWSSIALAKGIFALLNNQALGWKESFSSSHHLIWPLIWSSILVFLIVLGGALLLVVPGIIFMIWYSFYFFTVTFEGTKGLNALKASKNLVAGRWWSITIRLAIPALIFGAITALVSSLVFSLISLSGMPTFLESTIASLASSLVSSITIPLSSAATIILYYNAKQNPVITTNTPPQV